MLVKILITLAVLLVVFIIVVALQAPKFTVTRSTTIGAPAELVLARIDDFHAWDAWSPWAKLDPECKNVFEGPRSGPGAVFSWAGNSKVGEGKMTITDVRPGQCVRIRLEFVKPFACTNTAEFTLAPAGSDQTQLTWTMSGEKNFFSKAFGLFVDMDRMVGKDFEKGLASLKSVAEASAQPAKA